MKWLWMLLPLAFCLLRLLTHRYICSALITLSCAVVVAVAGPGGDGWLVVAALIVSAAGDWFMAHQGLNPNNLLFGMAGFAVAHVLLIAYAARAFAFDGRALAAVLLLGALYALYLARRVFPGVEARLKPAIAGYALVSLAGLFFALCRGVPLGEKALYALGIVCILFSDTMIAESDFVGRKQAGPLILPTYYTCQLLITVSLLLMGGA